MNQKYSTAVSLSVALHLALAGVLLFGDFSAMVKPTPTATATPAPVEPIKAVAVDKSKLDAHVKRIKKEQDDAKAREAKRIKDLEDRAKAAKRQRAKEQERLKRLEKQRKQKEVEKRKADKAAQAAKDKAAAAEKVRKQKEAEKKKSEKAAADAAAKRKKEEAAAKRAKELREKQEAERKRKEDERKRKEAAAKERARQDKLMAEELAREEASRQRARKQQVMTEIGRFTALITQTIQRNLITDKDTMDGKSCKLTISLAPSGFVTNVVKGAGDRTVCEAAQNAVYKAGTLPVSKDPDVFKEMKTISLTVVPEF